MKNRSGKLGPTRQPAVRHWPLIAAAVLTLIWVIALDALIGERWAQLLELPLNALGDFLAGTAGPIALIWIIAGYLQQGQELRLQIEELQRSVDHQGALAAAAGEQVEAARQQTKAALEALELDRMNSVEAKMPKFVLDSLRYEFDASSGTAYAANVRNDGSAVGRIRIIENVVGMAMQYQINSGYWGKGAVYGLRWRLPDPPPLDHSWTFDIVFEAAGATYFQRIRLHRSDPREPGSIDWSSDAIAPWREAQEVKEVGPGSFRCRG